MSHENGGSRLVCSFFENADDSIPLDADDHAAENNQAISPRNPSIPMQSLESIYISLLMDDNHELSFLPENLDVKKYLEPEKILSPQREIKSCGPSTKKFRLLAKFSHEGAKVLLTT